MSETFVKIDSLQHLEISRQRVSSPKLGLDTLNPNTNRCI